MFNCDKHGLMCFIAVILAAGKGTRMQSAIPKVLHKVGNRSMLAHVLQQAYDAGSREMIVVTGYGADSVVCEANSWKATISERQDGKEDVKLHFAHQAEQLGTGHAVQQAAKILEQIAKHDTNIAVLCGDVPLLRPQTINALIDKHVKESAACTLLTVILSNPYGFGRIVRKCNNQTVAKIVEERDCANQEERNIKEVNAGCYVFRWNALGAVLHRLDNRNAQHEYYLTDTIRLLVAENQRIVAIIHDGDAFECLGVNNIEQLQAANDFQICTARKTPIG